MGTVSDSGTEVGAYQVRTAGANSETSNCDAFSSGTADVGGMVSQLIEETQEQLACLGKQEEVLKTRLEKLNKLLVEFGDKTNPPE